MKVWTGKKEILDLLMSRFVFCTPIDGIWVSCSIQILREGYLAHDKIFPNTDHWCLWVNRMFQATFGHTMLAVVRPPYRRLNYRDPRMISKLTNTPKAVLPTAQHTWKGQRSRSKKHLPSPQASSRGIWSPWLSTLHRYRYNGKATMRVESRTGRLLS
jgi:hypothetical protein